MLFGTWGTALPIQKSHLIEDFLNFLYGWPPCSRFSLACPSYISEVDCSDKLRKGPFL